VNATAVNNQSGHANRSSASNPNNRSNLSEPPPPLSSHQHRPLKSSARLVQHQPDVTANQPRRYSPTSLENLFNVNINYLDTLSMSALQLEELDKIRSIGQAQQETVTLAHLLKEKNNALAAAAAKLKNEEKAVAVATGSKQRSQSAYSSLTNGGSSSMSSSSSSTHSSNSTLNEREQPGSSENETTETIKTDSMSKDTKKRQPHNQQLTSSAVAAHRSKSYDNNHSIHTASEINTDRRNCKAFFLF
jgi:hypothetical protein